MNYTIWIVSPYSHSQCFTEVAQSLQAAFIELGHNCTVVTEHPAKQKIKGNVIILGAHLLHPDDMLYLDKPVIWNLEQMPDENDARRNEPLAVTYYEILCRAGEVWDYSYVNIENLKKVGIEAKLFEIGYMPCLTRIENVPEPDIDVLFVGSMNDRRHAILKQLTDNGVKVVHAFDCYGVRRDTLIARTKIILNLHFYPQNIFEVVRVSYLLANRKLVVSEMGIGDYPDGVIYAPYEAIVDKVMNALSLDDDTRLYLEKRGFDFIRTQSQTEFLKAAL
jgi:hypothetical protein